MRRGLVLALTALVAATAPPALADVTVAPAGGEPVTLSLAQLEPDVRDRGYTLRGPAGEQALVVTGISIDRLLDRAGVDPFAFAGATVTAGDRSVALSRDQLIDPAAFPEGRPVLWSDASGTHFLRPLTGPGDLNDADRLTASAITIALAAADRLMVSARASRRRVEAGERVRFSAAVEGAAAGEDVRVSWTFDDGASGSGTVVHHRFRRPGTYKVVVGATSDTQPTGAFAIVTVRVGEPDEETPNRAGGGTDPDEDAPDSGVADGAGHDEAGGGSDEPSGGAAAPARERRARARRAAAERERRARARRAAAARERRARARRAARTGGAVAGVLLDDPGSPPAAAERAAARTGTPVEGGLALPPEVLMALAGLCLLAFGAWHERRPAGPVA